MAKRDSKNIARSSSLYDYEIVVRNRITGQEAVISFEKLEEGKTNIYLNTDYINPNEAGPADVGRTVALDILNNYVPRLYDKNK